MIANKSCMYDIKRRHLLAAAATLSVTSLAGCTSDEGAAEADVPDEDTPAGTTATEEPATSTLVAETSTPTPAPEEELPAELNDLYVREELGTRDLPCGLVNPYSVVHRQGDFIAIAAGRYAEQGCEQFEFVREEYDSDTSTLQVFVNWGVGGNEGCDPACSRGKELYGGYTVDFDVKGVQIHIAVDGGDPEVAAEWSR